MLLHLENRISIFEGDATIFNAFDEYDHFFPYNPFPGEVLKMVIQRIMESLKKRPRTILIAVLMETGYFKVTKTLHSFIKDYDTYIYQNIRS
jgi:predicted RND superfamily exporter protein